MSIITNIQWCDSTVNPIMGCGGCELFPAPSEVLSAIDAATQAAGVRLDSRTLFKTLVDDCFSHFANPGLEFKRTVNTTNIWHLRERFIQKVRHDHGNAVAVAAGIAIRQAITCYAAKLHLNKAVSIVNPTRTPHKGYAPIFERVTQFRGRVGDTAKLPDLLGRLDPEQPWKKRLPRMIFVSDMGDALSTTGAYSFLKSDMMPAINSESGKRHLWLWLTKRPGRMAEFSQDIDGFPANVCAMTTVTASDTLERIDQLRKVRAAVRGLSLEPLWQRIAPKKLNLSDIDWVIVGGESGSGDQTRPFALEWAEELREHCRNKGVAFFLKQLGRNPSRDGKIFEIRDKHGGDWSEWDKSLRVREFPTYFQQYRAKDMMATKELRRRYKSINPAG